MAHTKAKGAARINKDSISKRLGVKRNHGQEVTTGMIIVRQRGSTYQAGHGVMTGKDFTLFAANNGVVRYYMRHGRTVVSVQTP